MPIVCPFKVNLPPPRPFHEILFENFQQYGDKVALEEDNGPNGEDPVRLTYKELLQQSVNVANNLRRMGFRQNDVIAVYLENRICFAPLLLGVSALGGTLTGVNPLYTVDELRGQLADSRAKFVVTRRLYLEKVQRACGALPASQIRHVILIDGAGRGHEGDTSVNTLVPSDEIFQSSYSRRMPSVQIDVNEDVLLLPYSSGTTGLPKGVMLTHANLNVAFYARSSLGAFREGRHDDVSVMFMPFFHMTGFIALTRSLYTGQTGIVMPKFDPIRYVQLIAEHQAAVIFCVPSVLVFLTKSKEVDKYDLSNVIAVAFGAAPAGNELIDAVKKRFPNIMVLAQGYGMTESGGISTVTPGLSVGQCLPGSCGIPVPGCEIKVVSVDGKNTELGPMETGEICMRGPGIMKGYMNNEKATRETIDPEGWLHSGDLGYYDFFAHVYIVDRLKELIKYKAFQVAPAELEDCILKHPAVQEVGVVGIPDSKDPDVGELPTAFVVLKPGQVANSKMEENIKAVVAEHLAHYKHLRGGVRFCQDLPKGPSGKVMRRDLKLGKVKYENSMTSKL